MLTYNTHLKPLILPEYGRNIQQMVNHCLTIEDRDERTRCAYAIINAMGNLFPAKRNDPDARRTMWDHLAIMSQFQLDIDWPVEVTKAEELSTVPDFVPYHRGGVLYRHYGATLPRMVEQASRMEPGEDREQLILLLANQMKKALTEINPDGAEDERVFDDMARISHGAIRLTSDECRLHVFEVVRPATGKKKCKK